MSSAPARRVAVVTGASSGVGRATVRRLARAGYDVGLIARGLPGLEGARREVEALGRRALVCRADVSDAKAVEAAAAAVESALGPIDVWVNDAMVSVYGPVKELAADEIRRVTEVAYLGYVHGTLSALKRMLPRDRGVIVQIGSALAYRSIPLQAAYCAAKHAIAGFTESLRCELLHDRSGVRVTEVDLPAVNTPQFSVARTHMAGKPRPVAPVFEPELAAEAVLAAIESPRKALLFGAFASLAVQANKFFSGLLDRYLALTGYRGQLLPEPPGADRMDNLWRPTGEDLGAHGMFGRESSRRSPHLWLKRHRAVLGAAALAGTAVLVGRRRAR